MAEGDDHTIDITSTELTKALEDKDFEEAERLIKENRDPRYLNRGAYGSLPLILVLSGEAGYRNFYLAQLLVKQGADVNPYFPRQMADCTPLEFVVNFYRDMKILCEEGHAFDKGSSVVPTVIGLHRELNLPPKILQEQCWEMIDLLVAYGADPGVATNPKIPPVFHSVVADREPDAELIFKLHSAGGDFNREDLHGNTPLMDYLALADFDSALPLMEQILSVATELNVNHKNCNNETLLWRAMLAGSPGVAVKLIHHGANTTVQAVAQTRTISDMTISALFAPFLQNSVPYMEWHKDTPIDPPFFVSHLDKTMLCSVFPVVDCTDICDGIVCELDSILSSKTNFPLKVLVNQEIHENDVTVLMFGHLKSGLQQLCVRKIMEQVVVQKHGLSHVLTGPKDSGDSVSAGICAKEYNTYKLETLGQEALLALNLYPGAIEGLVKERLMLPHSVVPRFLIEAARLQLGAYLFTAESPGCIIGCDRASNTSSEFYGPSDYDDCDDYDDDNFDNDFEFS